MELINREDTIKQIKRLVSTREVDWHDCDLYDKAKSNSDSYLVAILDAIDVVEDMLTIAPAGIDGSSVIEHAEGNGESRDFIKKLTDYIEDADAVEPKTGDLIKREDVMERINEWGCMYPDSDTAREALTMVMDAIINIPSAEPKQGEWITEERDSIYGKKIRLKCSECGDIFDVSESAFPYERYCRYCGCRMKGADDA